MRWLAIFLLFLAACQQAVPVEQIPAKTECNPPYFEYEKGDCCLDNDANGVCDRDEGGIKINETAAEPVITPKIAPERTALSDAVIKFRQNVTSYTYKSGKGEVWVVDDRIHVRLDKITPLPEKLNRTIAVSITDVFVNRATQKATGYCDPRSEEKILGTFHLDRSPCLKIIDIPIELSYGEHNPQLPEDWILKYQNMLPVRVETNDQYIRESKGWRAVNPIIHLRDGSKDVVLRLELKTGLPIKAEITEGTAKQVVDYDTLLYNSVKPEQVEYQKFPR
jgi:hypothetical protein